MPKRDIVLLAALIAVYLFLAGAYCAIIPAATAEQHNPDENAHIEYVATLASGHLPVFTDALHGYENHQPPLYYALAVPVYLAARGHGDAAATRAVRGVSILLGALLILAAYGCIRTAFPQDRWAALGTAAFVGLLPGNVALSASVANDALTNLVTALSLWMLAKIVTTAESKRQARCALWLGITVGIGIWTKTSTLILFPTVLLACYLLAARRLASPASATRIAGIACGVGALIGLPWLLRNQVLYGDPMAQSIFTSAFSNTAQAYIITAGVYDGSLTRYLVDVAQWTFASFWGGFDSLLIFWGQPPHAHLHSDAPGAYAFLTYPPPPIYGVFALLSLASVTGLILSPVKRTETVSPPQNVLRTVFAVFIALTAVVFLRFILTYFQTQGRYLYPALVPLAFFFVCGWLRLLPRPRWQMAFVIALTAGLAALNLYTLFGLLLPRFA